MNRPTEQCRMQVSTLQLRLAKKATRKPEHRFTKLYDLLTWEPLLVWAFDKLMARSSSRLPGMERAQKQRETIITALRSQLKAGTYHHQSVYRETYHGQRQSLTLIDHLVQLMVKAILEPILERDFRPERHTAHLERISMNHRFQEIVSRQQESSWVVTGAIANCHNQIQHKTLLHLLQRRIRDRRLIGLIGQMLRAGVMEGEQQRSEGGVLSPLLTNVYLHALDDWFHGRQHRQWQQEGSACYVRSTNTFVVTWSGTKGGAEQLKADVATLLHDQLGLKRAADSIQITPMTRGYDFLGYRVSKCVGRGKNGTNLIIRPSNKSMMALKARIKAMTGRDSTRDAVREKIRAMNALLQRWATSHQQSTSRRSFEVVGNYAFKRMEIWLQKKTRQRIRAVYREYYQPSGGYRTWVETGIALQVVANSPEADRKTGEPDALKGARPVRGGV